jgi:hypothetical protein
MKIKVSQQVKNRKERIIFEFSPDESNKVEQKVMRSIASANFGESIFIRNKPIIQLVFKTKQKYKKVQRVYPPLVSKPELVNAHEQPALDAEEYESFLHTVMAQCTARSLGIKIPFSLAKKFTCRCGLIFVRPTELIAHRRVCPQIFVVDKDVMQRGETILARLKAEELSRLPVAKAKETFPCRCGHVFPNKRVCDKHQKKCIVVAEAGDVLDRGKSFLARVKDEGRSSCKSKAGKQKKDRSLGERVSDKFTKRERRRRKTT